MTIQRKLTPLTKSAVLELQAETGHELHVDDVDAILTLDRLAVSITTPADQDEVDLLNLPVPCGSTFFRRPSLAKCAWYERHACVWFADDPLALNLALGMICSVDNTENAILDIATPEAAQRAIDAFTRNLTCSEDEYAAARALVLPPPDDDDEAGESRYGPTCRLLTKACGNTVTYWFYEADIGLVRAMLEDYAAEMQAAQMDAKRGAMRSNRGKGGSTKPTPPPRTPKMESQKRFRLMKIKIRERWERNGQ